jgi:hypothetical protein
MVTEVRYIRWHGLVVTCCHGYRGPLHTVAWSCCNLLSWLHIHVITQRWVQKSSISIIKNNQNPASLLKISLKSSELKQICLLCHVWSSEELQNPASQTPKTQRVTQKVITCMDKSFLVNGQCITCCTWTIRYTFLLTKSSFCVQIMNKIN